MKILNIGILAFLLLTQTLYLQGCSQQVKTFECKLKCGDNSTVECSTSVDGIELVLP